MKVVHRRLAGFSLIELVVVLGIAMTVAGLTFALLRAEGQRSARGAAIKQQAGEMATLNRALEQYLSVTPGLPSEPGASFEVTEADLVTAGLLPSAFGRRPAAGAGLDVVPVSPLGQRYRLRAVRVGGGYRGVTFVDGAPVEALARAAGVSPTQEGVRQFNAAVMHQLRQEYRTAAGIATEGTTDVDTLASGFAQALGNVLDAPFAFPSAVALAGYSELGVIPAIPVNVTVNVEGGGGSSGGGSPLEGRACYLETSGGQCAANYESVWEHQVCSGWHDPLPVTAPPSTKTSLGALTIDISYYVRLQSVPGLINFHYSFANLGIYFNGNAYRSYYDGSSIDWPFRNGLRDGDGTQPPTRHHVVLGQINPSFFEYFSGNSPTLGAIAPGSTFSVARVLSPCPTDSLAIPLPVWRLNSGSIAVGSPPLSYWQPGTEVLSLLDPGAHGVVTRIEWIEGVSTPSGVAISLACRARHVANTSFSYRGQGNAYATAARFTNTLSYTPVCSYPPHSAYIRGSGGELYTVQSARPAQAIEHILSPSERPTVRYCCATR